MIMAQVFGSYIAIDNWYIFQEKQLSQEGFPQIPPKSCQFICGRGAYDTADWLTVELKKVELELKK
jgi:hypothetical protein